MHTYNTHFPNHATPDSLCADRESMLKGILGKVGSGVFIEPPFSIDYGCNISLGVGFYANFKCVPSLAHPSTPHIFILTHIHLIY